MKLLLPKDVTTIINLLQRDGHEAYAVGGCVRDLYLGKTPADWDITTSAAPEEVKALFAHTVDTGIEHGTVTVIQNHVGYEVTTYRIDGEYKDGRHPEHVTFTSLLSEDLRRRDFTINAMAYNEKEGLVDLFDGVGDIEKKMIRCVGKPQERFSEDALRMLRALRFSAQLGFSIAPDTYRAICDLSPAIAKVSSERIMVELNKLLCSEHPDCMRMAYETGLTGVFLPEFDDMMETAQNTKHHCYTVGEHTLHSLRYVPPEKHLRLAMLFHDIGKPAAKKTDAQGQDHFYRHQEIGEKMTVEILRRLKYDNATITSVKRLVRFHDERPELHPDDVRKKIVQMGVECFPDIFLVKRADTLAQSEYMREDKLKKIDEFERLYYDILAQGQCLRKKDMAVTGKDMMALGVAQGRQIGELLDALFLYVIEHPEKNTRSALMEKAKELIGEASEKTDGIISK